MDKDRITTARLVQELIDIPDSRWGTYGRNDKPITAAQVTRLLKPYGIKSGNVRIPKDAEATGKGYLRAWFEDAFTRYLPPPTEDENASDFSEARNPASEPGTPGTTLKTKDFSPESNPAQDPFVPGSKSEIPVENQHCAGCAGFEAGFSGGGKNGSLGFRRRRARQPKTCCAVPWRDRRHRAARRGQRSDAVWLHLECERFWVRALKERER